MLCLWEQSSHQTCSRILIYITDHDPDPFFRGDPKRILNRSASHVPRIIVYVEKISRYTFFYLITNADMTRIRRCIVENSYFQLPCLHDYSGLKSSPASEECSFCFRTILLLLYKVAATINIKISGPVRFFFLNFILRF